MSIQATLYTKAGCHLCERAVADLERLRQRYPHELRLVDITTAAELMRKYAERIPVLSIDGHERAAPLSLAVLERELRQAGAR
jgi:glutaredoxin